MKPVTSLFTALVIRLAISLHGRLPAFAYPSLFVKNALLSTIPTMNFQQDVEIFWHDEVTSTMDTARELIKSNQQNIGSIFAVVTKRQLKGRGTRGRSWLCGDGNLFMTIGIHRKTLTIPPHYLPLRTATLVKSALKPLITNLSSEMKLKWPNDILINGRKLCGILIEMEEDYFIIGIGCNVLTVPDVATLGNEALRSATAISEHNEELTHAAAQNPYEIPDYYKSVAIEIFSSFKSYQNQILDSPSQVIQEFSSQMDYSIQKLRDEENLHRKLVLPLYLNSDGTLQVQFVVDKSEATLISEYLW